MEDILFFLEIMGTVAFAISGAVLGIRKRMDIFGVSILGLTTGVGGGVLRDMMAGDRPYIVVKHFYASASLLGALACILLWNRIGYGGAMLLGATSIVVLRLLAARNHWSLPKADFPDNPKE